MKNKDIFIQESSSSCGACAVASIVSHYGGYVPLEVILEDTNTDLNGTSALYLKEALKKYGFKVQGLSLDVEDLKKYPLPAISHVTKEGYEHFIVIYSIKDDKVSVMDPAEGQSTYSVEYLRSISTDAFLIAVPEGEIPKYGQSHSLLNLLNPLLKELKTLSFRVLAISLALLLFNLLISFHLKILGVTTHFVAISTIFIFIELISSFLEFWKYKTLGIIEKTVEEKSLKEFTKHVFHLPIKVLKNRRLGEITHKIEDMTFIKNVVLKIAVDLPIDILGFIASLLCMTWISKEISLVYLGIIIAYSMISLLSKKRIYKNEKALAKSEENYKGTLVEYLSGIESIKNLNEEEQFLDMIYDSLKKYTEERLKVFKDHVKIDLLKSKVFKIGSLIANLVGYMALNETFTFLDLLTISGIFQIFYSYSSNILSILEELAKFKALLRNISEFYDLKTDLMTDCHELGPLHRLDIDNLSYSYNNLDYKIKNFSYNFKLGENYLIKGPSGIGKSTIVKCLSGFDLSFDGDITINGLSIKNLSNKYIKENIIYIGQEETLFTMSIFDNIALKDKDKSLFDRIAKITFLDEIISSKRSKENTALLENASNLSGGERARIILARALYHKPKILIIDETLSSIGESQENEIIKNLLSLKNISIIYITHRNKDNLFKNIIELRKEGRYEITRKRTRKY